MKLLTKQVTALQVVFVLLMLFLGIEDVVLVLQNRNLKEKINQLTNRKIELLTPGDRVEDVRAVSLNGDEVRLSYSDSAKKYLLLVFSTTCPHCEKNIPIWSEITRDNQDKCNYVGISTSSLEDTRKFVSMKSISFPTVSVANDTSLGRKYKIVGLPLTILLTRLGVVEKVWMGELTIGQKKEIAQLIGQSELLVN